MDALAVLQRLGTGQLIDELAEALAAVSIEVVRTGNPGKVTLTLELSTMNQGDPRVTILEKVQKGTPKRDPRGALFFAIDGELHKEDPRQIPLDFRTVDTTTGEIRDPQTRREERVIT